MLFLEIFSDKKHTSSNSPNVRKRGTRTLTISECSSGSDRKNVAFPQGPTQLSIETDLHHLAMQADYLLAQDGKSDSTTEI